MAATMTLAFVEVAVDDYERAIGFYGNVFDWAFMRAPSEAVYYIAGPLDGPSMAGILPAAFAPQTLVFFPTDDFQGTLKRITELGGRVIEAHGEEGLGSVAQWIDPDGNRFGLTEVASDAPLTTISGERVDYKPSGSGGGGGRTAFVEIAVDDSASAAAFYSNVFRWGSAQVEAVVPFHVAGLPDGPAMVALVPQALTPRTLPYFHTDDLKATVGRVHEHGGRVFHALAQEGYGPVAHCKDPDGNVFGLVQLAERGPFARIG